MRLTAIDLNEVGIFSEPVRIGGIGPGLNVLAGPNELGKSTILRGLLALFREAHSSQKAMLKDLRPYSGGAPGATCSFEIGGAAWRLEKQFLAARRALLERADGRETHHGADAENRLASLLAEAGDLAAGLPLLWVEQGQNFEVPKLNDGARHSLGQLLAAQAETTSGVGPAQRVLAAVEAELATLVTKGRGQPSKGGAYDKLRVEREKTAAALQAAEAKAQATEERLAQLNALQQEEDELADAAVTAKIQADLAAQQAAMQAAEEARRQLKQLNERIAFLDSQHVQRKAALAAHDEGLEALARITKAMAAADVELTELGGQTEAMAGRAIAAREAVEQSAKREQALRAALDKARDARQAEGRRARHATLSAQHARLTAIGVEVSAAEAELAALGWPPGAIAELRAAVARLEQLDARRTAGAPHVRLSYVSGRTTGYAIDGTPIADNSELIAGEPLTIEIEGVGQIEISPAASDAVQALNEEMIAAEAAVSRLLELMGARDLADAEAREESRAGLRHRRELLISERKTLAPDGEGAIATELEALRPAVDSDRQPDAVDGGDEQVATAEQMEAYLSIDDISHDLQAVLAQKGELAKELEKINSDKGAIDRRRAEIAAELRIRRTRQEELRAKFFDAGGADEARALLVSDVETGQQQLAAATREAMAVRDVVLPDVALGELKQRIDSLRARIERRGGRLAQVRQELNLVKGMLARDFEDGASEQAGDLRARLADIDQRISDIEGHIAALRLLAQELGAEAAQRRNQIARPLAARLTAMAGTIWPTAEIGLDSDLMVAGLVRDGRREATGAISAGTREQVAILARLAYAGMLAEGPEPVPLILDDPLVFSDDDRLAALFEVMASAAQVHQIIVLTCHQRAFEPLIREHGATRLTVERRPGK